MRGSRYALAGHSGNPSQPRRNKMKTYIFSQTVNEKTTIKAETEAEAWGLFECGNLQPECEGDEVKCEIQNQGD